MNTTVSPLVHWGLWVAQVLLAALFAFAGFTKVSAPYPELVQMMPYVVDLPGGMIRFIGAAELAGALGMILPAATRIKPGLTPMAGVGLLTIMVLASGFHISRGEFEALPITVGVGVLAALVSWGRTRKARIAARG